MKSVFDIFGNFGQKISRVMCKKNKNTAILENFEYIFNQIFPGFGTKNWKIVVWKDKEKV